MPTNSIVLQNANLISQHAEAIACKERFLTSSTDGLLDAIYYDFPKEQCELFEASRRLLLAHVRQFEKLVQDRYLDSMDMPQATLREIYDYVIHLQGLLNLSNMHFQDLNRILTRLDLNELGADSVKNINQVLSQIQNLQKNKFSEPAALDILSVLFRILLDVNIVSRTERTSISRFEKEGLNYDITIGFELSDNAWRKYHIQPFSSVMSMQVVQAQTPIPVIAYLLSDYKFSSEYAPQTITNLIKNTSTPMAYFQAKCLENTTWNSSYHPNTLGVSISNNLDNINTETLLLYLQTLIELINLQPGYNHVVIYAPGEQATRFCALGFYPDDNNTPRKETLKKLVARDSYHERETAAHKRFHRQEASGETLLRAFRFSLQELHTRPVEITEKKLITTYHALITDTNTRLIDPNNYLQEGVLPEFCRPQTITPSYKSLREREISGKPYTPKVHCEISTIDYRWIDVPKRLEEVGCNSQPDSLEHRAIRRVTYR